MTHTDLIATDAATFAIAPTLTVRRSVLHAFSDSPLPKYLLADEIRALLALPLSDHPRMLLRLLFNTGARVHEALAVTPNDINTVDGRSYVRLRTLKQQRRGKPGNAPQGAVRVVPLYDPTFAADLARYIATHCRNRRHPVFHNGRGQAISDETARNWLKRIEQAGKQAGVTLTVALRPHVLRHSFAVHCLLHRMPMKMLQDLLGHRYSHSTEVYTNVLALDVAPGQAITFG